MKTRALSFSALLFSFAENKFSQANNFKSVLSKKSNFKLPISPKILLVLVGVIVISAVIILFKNTQTTTASVANSDKPSAPAIISKQVLNKEFSFPIKDANNKELSKIKYLIQSASLQDEILVKGQRARAIQGRTFLILDLKITNTYNQGIQINSRDYVRLSVNGNSEELVAADIHNDPVEVQAISTKQTRIGFPINETDEKLELKVGEINGKKETVKITF